jgi:hypothetical protein
MVDMMTDPLARPLGRIERFYWLLDQRSCTNFVLSAELEPGLEPADLELALQRSWARHPRLRCRIAVDQAGTVVLEPEAAGPPRIAVVPGPWRAVADAQLLAQFPAGSHPLIRCHWVEQQPGAVAIFTFEHGLLDAGAAAAWLMELLADAAGQPPAQPLPAHPAPSDARYPPGARGLRGLLNLLRIIVMDGLGRRLVGIPTALPGAPPWDSPRRPTTHPLDLDPRASAALLRRCRGLGCTVQGALMAAQAMALRAELPGDGPAPIGLAAAMDLRPWLAPPLAPGTLGNHVSLLPITIRVSSDSRAPILATALSRQLRRKIDRCMGHLFWKLLPPPWLLPPDQRGLDRLEALGRAAPPSTVVTNLGRLPDPPPALAGTLRALRFTMAPQQGSPLCTGVVTVNGALRLDLCFDAAHLDGERRARVAARMARTLEALVCEEST